jgi:hypothetical protein
MKPLDSLFEKKAVELGDAALGGAASTATGRGPLTSALSMFTGPIVGGTMGKGLTSALSAPSDETIQSEAVSELFDPGHEAEITKIKTQAMLSEFLSTDPVISTYDPEEVTSAYNQVVSLAPRASIQPAVMRGLLRKLLQQQDAMEAFDVDQLVKIEQGLKNVDQPPPKLMAPEV